MILRPVERVLIAAHDADFAGSVAGMIASASVETRIVHRASFILAAIASFQPDVAIVELEMPDLDGATASSLMRATSQVPMLFTTDDVLVAPIVGPACVLVSKSLGLADLEDALRLLGLGFLEDPCRAN